MTDPHNHISYFQTSMDLYGATNASKCHMFSANLRGIARAWFDSLPNQSINSFKQLYRIFIGHFLTHKRQTCNMTSLWLVGQREGEFLRSYIKRFTLPCTDVKDLNNNLAVQVFSMGLSNKHVRYALIHKDISTMHELVAHVHKFVEVDKMRDHHSTRARQTDSRQIEPKKQKPSCSSQPQQREKHSSRSKAPKQ